MPASILDLLRGEQAVYHCGEVGQAGMVAGAVLNHKQKQREQLETVSL